MTPEKVRKLLAAATPGPWVLHPSKYVSGKYVASADGQKTLVHATEPWAEPPDAELIAAAPEIAQAYLDAQARVDALKEILETLAPFERAGLPYITPLADSIRDALSGEDD